MNQMCATVTALAESVETISKFQATKGVKAKPKTISPHHLWTLVALCYGTKPSDVPDVWFNMLQADTWDEALKVFVDAVQEEADAVGAPIPAPEFFLWQIKKILTFTYVPMEALSFRNRNEAPLGWLACLPRDEVEIAKLCQHDNTMEHTPQDSLNYKLIEEIDSLEKGQSNRRLRLNRSGRRC